MTNEKLDYTGLPFWERRRGDGPLTRLVAMRKKFSNRYYKEEKVQDLKIKREILLQNMHGLKRHSAPRKRLQDKVDEISLQLEAMGATTMQTNEGKFIKGDSVSRFNGGDGNGNRRVMPRHAPYGKRG